MNNTHAYSPDDLDPEHTGLESTKFLARQEALRQNITPDSETKLKQDLLTRPSGFMNKGEATCGAFRFQLIKPSQEDLPPGLSISDGNDSETLQLNTWHDLANITEKLDDMTQHEQLEHAMQQAANGFVGLAEGQGNSADKRQGSLEAAVRFAFQLSPNTV